VKNIFVLFLFTTCIFAQNRGFVTTKNGSFYSGGKLFHFLGFNAYYLQECAADSSRAYIVDDVFKAAKSFGFKVIRTWAFNDRNDSTVYGAIRYSPYGFKESGLRGLDLVVAKAAQYNIKLVLTFSNNSADYGGIDQYLKWGEQYLSRGYAAPLDHSSFFTNDSLKQWYKFYVNTLLERTNSFTGIKYKDDPAIFSFELMNEAVNVGRSAEIIAEWYREMSGFIKLIDANHLIATGEEGYDKFPKYYSDADLFYNGADYLFNGYKGTSYYINSALTGIDYCSLHLYPGLTGFSVPAGKTWLTDHFAIGAGFNKAVLPGEFGVRADKYKSYNLYFSALKNAQDKNCIIWQYQHKDVINNDGFGFNETNAPDLMNLFKAYALSLESDTIQTSVISESAVLYQNYPNPFNPITTIIYSLPKDETINLTLYNLLGERVGILDEGYKLKGRHERVLSAGSSFLSSGVYIYTLRAGGSVFSKKIILLK
jgi:mannan endo-1,4-beta-mannosidase